ncbi:MAG: ATP-dependent helicase [Clostridiales bacterium]|nr:ATP-dependent helicase [Clostridiales bacterium]
MSILTLNDAQLSAVRHSGGPMLVLAGPGSGKTTVIAYRVKNLTEVRGIPPNDILVITFTKAAAQEMRNRFLSLGGSAGVSFGTFHSFFFRIIRGVYGYEAGMVLHDYELKELITGLLAKMGVREARDADFISNVTTEISLVKNDLADVTRFNSKSLPAEDFIKLYKAYEEQKAVINRIDFDDMLLLCHELLSQRPVLLDHWRARYKHILIDEFQDINRVQYECVRLLASGGLFAVGDDDQSVYGFRGASPEFMLNFPEDFPGTTRVTLTINYRSTDPIIRFCGKVISRNKARYEKKMTGTRADGAKPRIIESDNISAEASRIGEELIQKDMDVNSTAVIYRTNIQARAFVDMFMGLNIPYQLKDEMPVIYGHWIAEDICAYLRLALNRQLDGELARIINKPARYISKSILADARKAGGGLLNALYSIPMESWQLTRIEELMFYLNAIASRRPYDAFRYIRESVGYNEYLRNYAEYKKIKPAPLTEVLNELQEGARSYETIQQYLKHADEAVEESKSQKRRTQGSGVTLTTMHSAKGLEFDNVFVASVVEGSIPHGRCASDAELEEERRLFYVAVTRAKENLYISVVHSRYEKETVPSRFVNDFITNGRKAK